VDSSNIAELTNNLDNKENQIWNVYINIFSFEKESKEPCCFPAAFALSHSLKNDTIESGRVHRATGALK